MKTRCIARQVAYPHNACTKSAKYGDYCGTHCPERRVERAKRHTYRDVSLEELEAEKKMRDRECKGEGYHAPGWCDGCDAHYARNPI